MDRKQFLSRTGIITGGTLLAGGVGFTAFFNHKTSHQALAQRKLRFTSFEEAMLELERLETVAFEDLSIANDWSFSENLHHLAQSIEFSMTGYPEHKPALFKRTLGKWAFQRFDEQGYMAHNLNEAIPGEERAILETEEALARLRKAVVDFEAFTENLKPHFAYGELSKTAYAKAHQFHLADHFAAMTY